MVEEKQEGEYFAPPPPPRKDRVKIFTQALNFFSINPILTVTELSHAKVLCTFTLNNLRHDSELNFVWPYEISG